MSKSNSLKKLTFSQIKKKNKVYDEMFHVVFDDYTLSINKVWSPIKINELIIEFVTNFEKDLKSAEAMEISTAYLYLLLLRHFTSLDIPSDVSKQLEWLEELIDSGYLVYIVNQLPEDQVVLVNNELRKALDNLNTNLPIIQDALSKYEFENEEIANVDFPIAE
jgi:hypothetical protein